jgi:hypothetical protein
MQKAEGRRQEAGEAGGRTQEAGGRTQEAGRRRGRRQEEALCSPSGSRKIEI